MDDLLQITNLIYATALTPEEWPQALEAITDLLRADHAVLQTNGAESADAPIAATARIDERVLSQALAAHAACDGGPLAAMLLPAGRAFTRAEMVPDRDFARSAYYNEVVRPMNGFHSATLRREGAESNFLLSICRPQACSNFDGRETTLLQALLPHLTAATTLHHRLRLSEHRQMSLASLIDRLDAGVILTDAAGRPSLVNRRASRIASDSDGLTLDDGGIAASTRRHTRRLHEAIAAVAADPGIEERRLLLPRPSHRPPLLVTLLPVWRLGMTAPGLPAPRIAIFIKEPDAPAPIDRDAVAESFRLTRRESEVAVLLTLGNDLNAVAASLDLGLGTVRHHLKRVYEKTGANSQAKLVALLRGFAGPLN